MVAIYSHHHIIGRKDCNSFDEAKEYLNALEDEGEGYALGIYDAESKTIFVAENMGEASEADIFNDKMDDFKKMGLEISRVEFY